MPGGMPRRINHEAVLAAWNAGGLKTQEIAHRFGCTVASVESIRKLARRHGQYVRPGVRGGAMYRTPRPRVGHDFSQGESGCLTCQRRITWYDRRRESKILPVAECCSWCGRRHDGLLRAPERIWSWIKGTLQTVDVP